MLGRYPLVQSKRKRLARSSQCQRHRLSPRTSLRSWSEQQLCRNTRTCGQQGGLQRCMREADPKPLERHVDADARADLIRRVLVQGENQILNIDNLEANAENNDLETDVS